MYSLLEFFIGVQGITSSASFQQQPAFMCRSLRHNSRPKSFYMSPDCQESRQALI